MRSEALTACRETIACPLPNPEMSGSLAGIPMHPEGTAAVSPESGDACTIMGNRLEQTNILGVKCLMAPRVRQSADPVKEPRIEDEACLDADGR